MSDIRKAILYSLLNQYSLQVISIVSIAILARLLSPDEIGVFAVATSIAFLATELRSFGVGEFLIREKDIDELKVRTVIGVMVIMSWSLATIMIVGAPWIGEFYDNAHLRNLLWIISVPFFLAPHSAIPYALLVREMKFASTIKVNLIGSLVRNGTSIGLALAGFSFYSLAWGTLAGVVAEFITITILRPQNMPWLPSFHNIKHVFQIGIQISVSKFLISTSQNASDLVLGRLASMKDVGLYSRGLGLILFLQSLITQAVAPVALPHLSQVKRTGGSVAEAYIHAVALVGAFALPLFAVVNIAAHPMINALFGDQWDVSVGIASTLAIWAMLQSIHCFSAHAFLTLAKERFLLIKEVISFSVKLSMIILAVPHGLQLVAWGFVVSGVIDLILITALLKHVMDMSIEALTMAFIPNILVAAACWSTLKVMTFFIDFHAMNAWLALCVIGAAMVPTWLVSLKLTNNRAWPFIMEMAGKITKGRIGSAPTASGQ